MEENQIREHLEGALDLQDVNYSLSVDIEEEYITVALTYEGDFFPRLGKELEDFLDGDYKVEIGDLKPEKDLENTRSYTLGLGPVESR